jgi:hypothetical protein
MPTTNNNWPTPVATDLVKDGWEAIKDLGDAIDTTLGVYAPSTPGLTLINTTSFSGVSSQAVNPFSATYDAYKIVLTLTAASGNPTMTFRIRNGATDKTAGEYYFGGFNSTIGTSAVGAYRATGATALTIGDMVSSGATRYLTIMDIVNPFNTTKTKATYTGFYANASDFFGYGVAGLIDDSTSYDGYNIIASTGTITGKVVTYGYNL